MKKQLLFVILILSVNTLFATQFSLYDLTCDNEKNPIGIDSQDICFSWKSHSDIRNFKQTAYRLFVATSPELLKSNKGDIWDSGKTMSDRSVLIPFEGKRLTAETVYYWKVFVWSGKDKRESEIQRFSTALFSEDDWGKSLWICLEQDKKDELLYHELNNKQKAPQTAMYAMPQFRKEFNCKKDIRRATAYICGVGHFELFLNGEKVGNNFLDPGWTKYDKEALYVTFDITNKVAKGANTFGVMLGNGFYNIPNDGYRYKKLLASYGAPKMRMKTVLEYYDGTSEEIISDQNWKAAESPVTFSSIYGGEDYDATKEYNNWKLNSFDDKNWANAKPADYNGKLSSQREEPLKIHTQLPPVSIFKNDKGKWVYDFGQNFSGIIRITVKAQRGNRIKMTPAELLNPDKSVNQSATGTPSYFSYTAKGETKGETWQPQFTYYGLRYIEIDGAVPFGKENPENLPEIVELTGIHTSLGASECGSFNCSKQMFNQIHNLIDWAIRSNMASVLTDCPHREKLGWLEEAHLMQYSLQYRYNLSRLYRKTMRDMRTAQLSNGCIPTIAPEYVRFSNGFEDTPEWGSSYIISPWYIYLWYGDTRILEEHYANMKKYIDYLTSRAENHIISYGLGDWFDIGPNVPGRAQLTSNALTATAIYYYDVTIMARIAGLLKHYDDFNMYKDLASKIKKAFNSKFFDSKSRKYERNSQTASAISLYAGLVDDENRNTIVQNLINDIADRNYALTAGDVGYRYVLRALESTGNADVIYKMNSKYDVPGYGWQLAHGATALTESWQAYGFVSNNHFMLGHLMEWLYGGLGGIRQQENSVAFNRILIDPQPVGDITWANTSYESPYGTIRCEWKDAQDKYTLKLEIPANAEAIVVLPTNDIQKIKEYGEKIDNKNIRIVNDKIHLSVGSGNYYYTIIK